MRIILTLLLVLMLMPFKVFPVHFERLGVEHGLTENHVSFITQDKDGFMWFGTGDGLNRFDGYKFKQFRLDPEYPGSISDSYLSVTLVDNKGIFWVGTFTGGLNKYNPAGQDFTVYRHIINEPTSLSSDHVTALVQDQRRQIWIGTPNGLNRFDQQNNRFSHFRHDGENPTSQNYILSMLNDSKDVLWLGTKQGIMLFDHDTEQLSVLPAINAETAELSRSEITALYEDSQSNVWAGTNGSGLYHFDRTTNRWQSYKHKAFDGSSLSHSQINAIVEDNSGQLWIGTENGLNLKQSDSEKFARFYHQASDSASLSHSVVLSLFADNNGLVWIGTFGGGINKIDNRRRHFGHVKQDASDNTSLSHNLVMAFHQDHLGHLWVGTEGGGLMRQYDRFSAFDAFQFEADNPNNLADNRVRSIVQDADNRLWIATLGGLNYLDSEHITDDNPLFGSFKHSPEDESSLSYNQVSMLYVDRNNTLWVGTWGGGLNRFDRQTQTFERFQYDPNDDESLSGDVVTMLNEDTDGRFWVGTLQGGLNLFDRSSKKFRHFKHEPNNPGSISSNTLITVIEDSTGQLWVGTYGGLNKFNPEQGHFKHYRKKQGLPNDVVYCIVEDDQQQLWLSTNEGLSRFNPVTETFRNFGPADGLQSKEFNSGAFLKTSSGEIFFGGLNGFNRFFPKQIQDDTYAPPLRFTDFLVLNKAVDIQTYNHDNQSSFYLPSAIDQITQLTLSHRLNLISFEFAALNYRNVKNNRYFYKLDGFDDEWIETGAQIRRATYTHLPHGDYTLRVKAFNADGYRTQELKLDVIVPPPWYHTWSARIGLLLVLLIDIYAVLVFRTRALKKRAKELELKVTQRTATINQLMEQKEKMFTNISHEFKTPLALILAPIESIHLKLTQAQLDQKLSMMKRNGQRLLRLVEQLLELAKLETPHAEQKYYYSLSTVLNRLLSSFEPLFTKKSIQLNHQSFEDVIVFMTPNSLEMILNNLISNALKYTPDSGEITICVSSRQQSVTISVEDTGIGISKDNQAIIFNRFTRAHEIHDENVPGAGIGLALVKELVEANQGSISLHSQLSKGSTFIVTLPISEATGQPLHSESETVSSISEIEQIEHQQPSFVHQETEQSETTKEKVLLIDDNADMLSLLEECLGSSFHCLRALNGEVGIELACEHIPDLVISDLMMPGISGFEVLKKLKQDPLTNHIPVVLLTAKGDIQSRLTGWAEKADEYLEKPFNVSELKARVENLLTIRKLLQQRYQNDLIDGSTSDQAQAQIQPTTASSNLETANQDFLKQVYSVLEQHYPDELLDVAFLASKLSLSQRQLHRKMKSLFDLTPNESIRSYRLRKAAEKLQAGHSPSLVYHQVGFHSHSYFSQCFKARYNCIPSDYAVAKPQ